MYSHGSQVLLIFFLIQNTFAQIYQYRIDGQRQYQDGSINSLPIFGEVPNSIANGLRQAFAISNQQSLGNLAAKQLIYTNVANSLPINNSPVRNLPVNNLPFNSLPINNLPNNGVPGLPLNNFAPNNLNDIQLANILANFASPNRWPRNININNGPNNNYLPNNNIIPNAALANALANMVTGNILSGKLASQIVPNRNLVNSQQMNGLQISNLANELNLANFRYTAPNQGNNFALSTNFGGPNNGCGCNTGVPNKFSVPIVPTNSIAKLPLYNGMPVIKIKETVYQVGPCGC